VERIANHAKEVKQFQEMSQGRTNAAQTPQTLSKRNAGLSNDRG